MELIALGRILAALVFVLGLIALAAALARKSGLAGAARGARRLALVETLALDAKRRAAILRCDGRDHLVVISGETVTVIETGLAAPAQVDEAPAAVRGSARVVSLKSMFRSSRADETQRLRIAGAL